MIKPKTTILLEFIKEKKIIQFIWALIFAIWIIIAAMWYEQANYCSISEKDRMELELLESI
jgi:hypothetical protein